MAPYALCLDQNYLNGIVKREPAFRELEPALPRCRFVTCDAFMADVVRRSGLDARFRCELYTGRRVDVERLGERLEELLRASATAAGAGPAGTGVTVPEPETRG